MDVRDTSTLFRSVMRGRMEADKEKGVDEEVEAEGDEEVELEVDEEV